MDFSELMGRPRGKLPLDKRKFLIGLAGSFHTTFSLYGATVFTVRNHIARRLRDGFRTARRINVASLRFSSLLCTRQSPLLCTLSCSFI